MMKKRTFLLLVQMAVLVPVLGLAGLIGDPAPPLDIKEWIKGKPVEVKPGTNIFVVEIFTTTSLPSWAAITNLNELQKRFKDKGVMLVGVSDEPADKIKEFVTHEGSIIEYAVAADNERRTSLGYMKPVRQRGVPHAFVVGKDGKLLWHGHPLDGLDEALTQITAGTFNVEQAAKTDLARSQLEQYLTFARQGDPRAGQAGRRFLAIWTNDVTMLCDLALRIAADRSIRKRDLPLATAALDRAEMLAPTNTTKVLVTRAIFLFETGKQQEGMARAKAAIASANGQKEKARAEDCLRTMTALLEAAKTNQTKTNQIPKPPAKP
jgi:hypothetical protein